MDRVINYDGETPQTTEVLQSGKSAMIGLGFAAGAMFSTDMVVNGFETTPTTPVADLNIQVAPGSIYATDITDVTPYGSLGTDSGTITKQGISYGALTFAITPPGTPGFSQVFLVQATLTDTDAGSLVVKYYNASDPNAPYDGPGGSGASQYTKRTVVATVNVKAGTAAATGTEATPSPDSGYVGLYAVTVANGATQITGADIVKLPTAPFFPSLPEVPVDVQNNYWTYAVDTGTFNLLVATVYPPVDELVAGLQVYIKVAETNNGVTTFDLNDLGPKPVKRTTGDELSSGDLVADEVVALVYDGAAWQVLNWPGPIISAQDNYYTTYPVAYATDHGSVNQMIADPVPAIAALTAGFSLLVKVANTNTGPTTIQVNGLAATTIRENGATLLPNAVLAGEIIALEFDGTYFQKQPRRWPYFSFDIASMPARWDLEIGDQLNITFTNQAAVPLNVKAHEGVYKVDFFISANNSANTDLWLYPNDISSGFDKNFSTWGTLNSDRDYQTASPWLNPRPRTANFGVAKFGYGLDIFDGPCNAVTGLFGGGTDYTNDVGPFIASITFTTYTASKTLRWSSGIAGGASIGFGRWADTTTPWTSLGSLIVNAIPGGPSSQQYPGAILSGTVIVKRLA